MNDSAHLLSTIRKWLASQSLQAGQRLPSERELAERFCVNRAELRKALALLEEENLIRRHVGRGTFVTGELGGSNIEQDIAARTSPVAAMQARIVIEPELARLAALNATPLQITEMRNLASEMRNSETWDAYADLDWKFHNLIAAATGNVLLAEVQNLLNNVRRYVVWANLDKELMGPSEGYHSFEEHEHIIEAIISRNSKGAMSAMRRHLDGTMAHLTG